MKRTLRTRLLWTVIVVAVVLAGLPLLLGRLVPTERMRRLAEEQTAAATGADVELGEASVRLWPRLAVRMSGGRIEGTGAALAARTGSKTDIVAYSAQVKDLAVELEIGALLRGRIRTAAVELDCPSLRLEMKDGTLQAERLVFRITEFSLPTDTVGASTPPAHSSRPPGETIPEELVAGFTVRAERLLWANAVYEEVVCRGELDARLLMIEEISARQGGGVLSGTAEVDFERDPWGILHFEVTADSVPASALLAAYVPELGSRLDCDLSGEVSGGAELRDSDTATRTLDCTGRVHGADGVLHAGDWLADVAAYLGDRRDLTDIRFDSLQHVFRIAQGRYRIEELTLTGPDTDWTGDGWIGLDGGIDANLVVKLPAGFTPDLGQWSWLAEGLRDEEGRVNLALHLSGEAARPEVGLKLGGGGESGAKKGLGGFLDKLKSR